MKILIVSNSFFPLQSPRSFRTTELVKELCRKGHDISLLIPFTDFDYSNFKKNYKCSIFFMPNVSWKSFPPKGNIILNFIKQIGNRILEQYFYYPNIQLENLVFKSLKGFSGYDLLISIASPHTIHWGVNKSIQNGHHPAKKWIADCGDPFMFAENLQYKRPFYFKYKEKGFCECADAITVPTEGAIEGYYPEFRNKIHIIPQGFKFRETMNSVLPENQVPTFAYAGAMNRKRRNPSYLLNYLIQSQIDFKFYVFSKNLEVIKVLEEKYPDRIISHGYIDRQELLIFLQKIDFALNFENIGSTQTPSKLIDYAILKKPILSIPCIGFDKTLINDFFNGDYSKSLKISNLDDYRIENVVDKFIQIGLK